MRKFSFHSPRVIKALTTALIWLTAAVVMSACSTHTKPAPVEQPKAVETTIPAPVVKKAIVKHPVQQKKSNFFALMKPIIVDENNKISQQRQQIMQLKHKKVLSKQDSATLATLSSTYGITMPTTPDQTFWNNLLNRVNIIPVELALVQAANESAWGTSRFAREGNNYFGQWCFQKGCGIVPKQRAKGAAHEVRYFKNKTKSVRAYMKNINSSGAYANLRTIRSKLQKQQQPIQAELLANGLKNYSERGMAYVKTIQSMIRKNRSIIDQTEPVTLAQDDAR
ncbi:flagellar biosynthesis protein FlgJ [Mariprofundus sp. EBB-1]|uniref:glucosaminidase domain-containing protein n=1 Tax=Mariprofundus sp. EBB-1 TaxID=2650971 RepID=UPI000EF1B9F0|nr:glucosaminidase domain-containing protein [Mariprofundus sp. EBB-1]RLL52910.1 flagellar biosynthesis protein FlgJ [Mariprofundus sp. EBB-1]